MTQKIGHERVLEFNAIVACAVACVIVREMPSRKIPGRYRQPERQAVQPLAPAYSHIYRKPLVNLVETLQLSAEIGDDKRQRHVIVAVIVVQAEIHGKRKGRICFIVGIYSFKRHAASQSGRYVVAVGSRKAYILGAERACDAACDIGRFHLAVAEILH